MDVRCTIDIKWDGEEKEKGVETCHEESGEALKHKICSGPDVIETPKQKRTKIFLTKNINVEKVQSFFQKYLKHT